MSADALHADIITYNSAISACEKLGQWQIALGLMTSMSSSATVPNMVTLSSAISCTVQAGKWQEALRLYKILVESEMPTVITCNSMLAAFTCSLDSRCRYVDFSCWSREASPIIVPCPVASFWGASRSVVLFAHLYVWIQVDVGHSSSRSVPI